MKRSIIIIVLTLFFVSIFFSSSVFAESSAEKYLGMRALCVEIVNIRQTRVLDDQTILFETYGGSVYINRLPATCFNLKNGNGFAYGTSLNRLCGQDIIEVVETGSAHGSVCGLGKFIELKGVKRITAAVKLLIDDGVLEALVKEEAFETAFPMTKSK